MPTLRPILTPAHQREFEQPPQFTSHQRRAFFQLDESAKRLLRQFDAPISQAGFLLQLGYFRATNRFFAPATFRRKDWEFVLSRLRLTRLHLINQPYPEPTARRHRRQILHALEIAPFQGLAGERCQREADELITRGLRLPAVFGSLCDFLRTHRLETPAYSVFVRIINRALRSVDEQRQQTLRAHLEPHHQTLLTALLEQLPADQGPLSPNSPLQLTRLRAIDELMSLKAIRQNVHQFRQLKHLYQQCRSVLGALNLSDAVVEDYALQVMRSRSWQVKQWVSRDLYLLCFCQYQYFYLSDVLTKTLIRAVMENTTQCEKKYKLERQVSYQENMAQLTTILHCYIQQAEAVQQRQASSTNFSAMVVDLLVDLDEHPYQEFLDQLPQVKELYGQITRHLKEDDYYDQIEAGSLKLQARVADLIRHLEFAAEPVSHELANAISHFQARDGVLGDSVPTAFLKPSERAIVRDAGGKLRVSLYKSLLARHLVQGLKNGSIYVPTSHDYKSIDACLIEESTWQAQKSQLLERAGMSHLTEWETVRTDLQTKLVAQLGRTTGRIHSGENGWVEKRRDNTLRFLTPTLLQEAQEAPLDLFPQDRVVPLYEVLQTIQQSCGFLEAFEPARRDYRPPRPAAPLFMAGIIGMGCNLTTQRVAKTAKNISAASLETTVRTYFNSVNVQQATDRISALIEQLNRSGVFSATDQVVRSSSDGQKFRVALNSIHSTYSAKYFGKEKGITIYSFINAIHNLYYSTAFSASDREAWYVIDGLVHNDVFRSQMHSTDTHGATDPIFCVSYLLGVDFQPRLSRLHQIKLHGLSGVDLKSLRGLNLPIGDDLHEGLVSGQWDRILRLVVSVKLKHTLASLVMKRLNSYAIQNPLYRALQEVGKVVQTEFILRYMDDEQLRHQIHQQQEKSESAHALSRAVAFGNNGVLQYANQEELLTMQGCKRLIANAVICWNYLYMHRLLINASPPPGTSDYSGDVTPDFPSVLGTHQFSRRIQL